MMEQNNLEELKSLADQVREFYPLKPELAFNFFRISYPEIVSATMVSIVWGYMEYEAMMQTGLKFTRPMRKRDIGIFNNPFLLN